MKKNTALFAFFIASFLICTTGFVNAQQNRLKERWLTSFGISFGIEPGVQVANRVITNSAGEALFAGSGECAIQPKQGGQEESCMQLLEAEYLLPDGYDGNLEAQIFGDLSPQGDLIGLPYWLYSCDPSFTGDGEDLIVTSDDSRVCLGGTCFGAFDDECLEFAGVASRAFMRVFDANQNEINTFTFPPTGADGEPCSPPLAEGRAVAIDKFSDNLDLIYVVGPNRVSGNSFVARYYYFNGTVEFLDSFEFNSNDGSPITANDVFVDSEHNVYVAGASTGNFDNSNDPNSGNGADVFVVKFNYLLVEQWRKQIDIDTPTVTSGKLNVNAIVVDDDGMVFVGGSTEIVSFPSAGPYLFKFDQSDLMLPVHSYIEGDTAITVPIFADNSEGHIEDLVIDVKGNTLAVGRVVKDQADDDRCGTIINFKNNLDGSFEFRWEHEIEDAPGYGMHIDRVTQEILVSGKKEDDRAFVGRYVLLGDVNCDGAVDQLDVDPFVVKLGSGTYCLKADVNCDGILSGLDSEPFVNLITTSN